MRSVPPDLAAELASGATTLCRCWKAMRRDGSTFGFTDHDRDLVFNGVQFKASTGLEASEAAATIGFAVGGGEVAGALTSEAISEADIASGKWDGASVETWLVDWSAPTRRLLLDSGQIGDIQRSGETFTAEVRSLAHLFDQEKGRRYEGLCSAELGDVQCGAVLDIASRRVLLGVLSVSDSTSLSVAGLPGFSAGSFSGGKILFVDGPDAGLEVPVMSHAKVGGLESITLWSEPPNPLAAGRLIRLTVSCDKRFATCRDLFVNTANFRGFPHLPGNDFLIGYARQGEPGQDGGAAVL
ncbi:MAG: DUF2163 domain-containing protein [Beijerinckiaceae bacterium]